MLQKAKGNSLAGRTTREGHMPVGRSRIADTQGKVDDQDRGYDTGVNDVNVDQEMTEIATTALSYRLAHRVLSMKYNIMREAISGRVR